MSKMQEKLLVATLSGLILVGAAGFAMQPGLIGGSASKAQTTTSAPVLDLRLTPRA